MSDWGTGASSKKQSKPLGAPKRVEYFDCKCVKCGFDYMLKELPDSTIYDGSITPPYKIVCRNCRKETNKHTPSPPPASVQMTIDEVMRAKK